MRRGPDLVLQALRKSVAKPEEDVSQVIEHKPHAVLLAVGVMALQPVPQSTLRPTPLLSPLHALNLAIRYIELENKQMNFDILTNPDHFLHHTKRYILNLLSRANAKFRNGSLTLGFVSDIQILLP
jgi:hypothetical protein